MDIPTSFNIVPVVSGITEVVKWLFVFVIIGVVCLFFWWYSSYKNTIVIRELTGSKKRIIIGRWKIWKDPKNSVEYLRIFGVKGTFPLPPDEALDVNKKGRFFIEAYRDIKGEMTYIVDKNIPEFFQPFTTNQRLILAGQIRKAESKGGKSFMEQLPLIIGLSFVVVVFLGLIVNMEEISQPMLESKNIELNFVKTLDNIVQTQQNINMNLQKIGSQIGIEINNSVVVPD